jgi:predicted TPR repeat methyltransferase
MRRISMRPCWRGLDYRAPEILHDAVEAVKGRPLRLGSVLDLGCGTGLAGVTVRPFCDWLVGVDLSPAMIAQARAKGLYDQLTAGDLTKHLVAAAGAQHHLVLAADVLVYCSDLAPVASAVSRVLTPDGLFAFTVEAYDGGGVALRDTLRYAHGRDHVRASIAAAGLRLRHMAEVSTRTENGAPVPGLVVIAGSK